MMQAQRWFITLTLCLVPIVGLWWVGQTLPRELAVLPAPSPLRSARASTDSRSSVTYPPQLLAMAAAVTTALAPSPTPEPTLEPYVTSTVPPPILCGEWVQYGTVCQMPKAPKPTPTPLPVCPVEPDEECRWMGQRGDEPPVKPSQMHSPS